MTTLTRRAVSLLVFVTGSGIEPVFEIGSPEQTDGARTAFAESVDERRTTIGIDVVVGRKTILAWRI